MAQTTNFATYFRWSVVLIIVIAMIWFYFKACHHSGGSTYKNDTLSIKHDTTWLTKRDTISVPYEKLVPYKVTYYRDIVKHDTLETIETVLQHVDSAKILSEYLATRLYGQDYPVQYGYATIYDTITQNRIVGRSIMMNQDIPVVKETVTLKEKPRLVVFAGIAAMGNKDNLPYASGVTLDLLLKNGGMIGGGAYLTNDKPMYGIAMKFRIRLKKR